MTGWVDSRFLGNDKIGNILRHFYRLRTNVVYKVRIPLFI